MGFGGELAKAVADEISERQSARGMSNRALAAGMGVTHPYVSKRLAYEADFSLDDIARAAELFEVEADELVSAALRRAAAGEDWRALGLAARTGKTAAPDTSDVGEHSQDPEDYEG